MTTIICVDEITLQPLIFEGVVIVKVSKTIIVKSSTNQIIQDYLDMDSIDLDEEGICRESIYRMFNTVFDNGFVADIKVCTTEDDFFIDAILFDEDGNEISFMEPEYELLGEYVFYDADDNEFIVNVVIGEDGE